MSRAEKELIFNDYCHYHTRAACAEEFNFIIPVEVQMKERLSASFRLLLHYPAVIRLYIILLIAFFALSGSLLSQEMTKNRDAGNPCAKGNCVNGKGEMNFATGDVYKGTFRKGLAHGQGEMTWKSGDRYKGGWKDGKMDGRGEMKWAMGDRYAGSWSDNQMNGVGEMTWKNGMKYTGQWKNGRQHGNGVLTSTDRKVTRGKWDNGTLIVDAPKGGGIAVAGSWLYLCRESPFSTDMSDLGSITFNADKSGKHTQKTARESGSFDTPFTWELKGSELTLTFKGDSGPRDSYKHVYHYDSGAKVFNMAKEDFGPEKNVSRCMLKKK